MLQLGLGNALSAVAPHLQHDVALIMRPHAQKMRRDDCCHPRDGVQNSFRRTESSKQSGCVANDAKSDANGTWRAA